MRKQLEKMYLDYFNNFLTVENFANYYGITEDKAYKVIATGRKINHSK